jgi:16S rRNA (guanine(966)-N(2))-methyltransferase RsmD
MRIISGIYGRRRFTVPSTFNARPTTDFAKENIFNVLSNLTDWEGLDALDLFSGTGSISFELLSRGCRQVTAVENQRAHVSFIAKVAKELGTDGLNLICGDAFRFLHTCRNRTFGFVFADPPYALKELADVPPLVLGNGSPGVLMDGGIFVMEHSGTYDFSHLPGFQQRRAYGSVHFSIFVKEEEKTGA